MSGGWFPSFFGSKPSNSSTERSKETSKPLLTDAEELMIKDLVLLTKKLIVKGASYEDIVAAIFIEFEQHGYMMLDTAIKLSYQGCSSNCDSTCPCHQMMRLQAARIKQLEERIARLELSAKPVFENFDAVYKWTEDWVNLLTMHLIRMKITPPEFLYSNEFRKLLAMAIEKAHNSNMFSCVAFIGILFLTFASVWFVASLDSAKLMALAKVLLSPEARIFVERLYSLIDTHRRITKQ